MYLGDFRLDQTVYVPFATYGSSNESITLTGLAVTDIEVFKNGSVTERSSDNGYTLLDTDGIDFDGRTGIHGYSIDLSDDTDSGFYVAQAEYMSVVDAVTVDSQTVRFIHTFSIQNRAASIHMYHPDGVLDASGTPTSSYVDLGGTRAGSATDGRYDGLTGIVTSGTGAGEFFVAGALPDSTTYNGTTKRLTFAVAPSTTLTSSSNIMFFNMGYQPTVTIPTNFGSLGIESDGDVTKVNTLDGHTPQTGDAYDVANSRLPGALVSGGHISASVEAVNGSGSVTGDGSDGDPWNPP